MQVEMLQHLATWMQWLVSFQRNSLYLPRVGRVLGAMETGTDESEINRLQLRNSASLIQWLFIAYANVLGGSRLGFCG